MSEGFNNEEKFIDKANQLEADFPFVSYYLRLHAIKTLNERKQKHQKILDLIDQQLIILETKKKQFGTIEKDKAEEQILSLCSNMIKSAVQDEASNTVTKKTIKLFYTSLLCLESLKTLKGIALDEKTQKKIKFCKYKCVTLTKTLLKSKNQSQNNKFGNQNKQNQAEEDINSKMNLNSHFDEDKPIPKSSSVSIDDDEDFYNKKQDIKDTKDNKKEDLKSESNDSESYSEIDSDSNENEKDYYQRDNNDGRTKDFGLSSNTKFPSEIGAKSKKMDIKNDGYNRNEGYYMHDGYNRDNGFKNKNGAENRKESSKEFERAERVIAVERLIKSALKDLNYDDMKGALLKLKNAVGDIEAIL